MAVVIPLAPHRRSQTASTSSAPRQEEAMILFFTGVRYERQAEPAAAEPAVRRRRPALAAAPAVVAGTKRVKKATNARQPA